MVIAPASFDGEMDPLQEDPSMRVPSPIPMLAPLFLLAPPRSFTSVVCAMLGQHPQMYGFPETQLFTAETLAGTWASHPHVDYPKHGLRRVVAQLYFGEQTETSVKLARGWLRRRAHFNTGFIFELLAEKIYPLISVEKSPDVVCDTKSLERMYRFFPQARFIHLLRHPRGHGESNVRVFKRLTEQGQQPPHWALFPAPHIAGGVARARKPAGNRILDPQRGWYLHNTKIVRFLESVPKEQKIWIRGEELLGDPDQGLRRIADWMGIRADPQAIEQMKHPERSPYALLGPPGAEYGNSTYFIESPVLRSDRVKPQSLEGPLSWREDNQGFLPEVKRLARDFGYS